MAVTSREALDQQYQELLAKHNAPSGGTSKDGVAFGATGGYDGDVYSAADKFAGYDKSIVADDEGEEEDTGASMGSSQFSRGAEAPHMAAIRGLEKEGEQLDPMDTRDRRITARQNEYQNRRLAGIISPARVDPFGTFFHHCPMCSFL
ncbi:splicing factor 3B subunit 1-like [Sycon ciliatum]|uniref:splicing factor 3B subunit 1-like n=1 Tax=Sycon ciliatum TaxID=27933 RepID=UPI0031F6B623